MCKNYFYTVVETLLNATPLPMLSITITVIIATTAVIIVFLFKKVIFHLAASGLIVTIEISVLSSGIFLCVSSGIFCCCNAWIF